MVNIIDKLLGGDLRSIGKADEVAQDILEQPSLFGEVLGAIKIDSPIIRMRAADAIEKVSKLYPEYLLPYKDMIINELSEIEQQEVRWHVALMFSYLDLTDDEKSRVIEKLLTWINNSKSRIVTVNSIEALVSIAERDERYRAKAVEVINKAAESGIPSLAARSKKIMLRCKI